MNQEFDNLAQKSNRFIFSDEFYDQLDSTPEEENVSFDVPKMSSQTISGTFKEESAGANQEPIPSFFSNTQSNNLDNSNEIKTVDLESKIEESEVDINKIEIPYINNLNTDVNIQESGMQSNLKEENNNKVSPEVNQDSIPSFFSNTQSNNLDTSNEIKTVDLESKIEEPEVDINKIEIPYINNLNTDVNIQESGMQSNLKEENNNEVSSEVNQDSISSFFSNIQSNNLDTSNEIKTVDLESKNDINAIEIPAISNLNTDFNPQVVETQSNLKEDIKENSLSIVAPIIDKNNNYDNSSVVGITNNFNVETGIDTALEQEILKSKVESQTKIPIVEKNNFYEQPSEEKMVYRARRNTAPVTPIWQQEEINNETNNSQEENPVNSISLTDIMPEHYETEVQSKVINIDEELAKLAESNSEAIIEESVDYEDNLSNLPVTKSDLLDKLREKEMQTGKMSILSRYGEDFCSKDYITNPAIGRTEEIKQLILILLTPEKSAILVGKPGIGKTSIVEGLAYQLQRNNVPDALKGYCVVSVKTTSLIGTLPNGETRLQTMIDELKDLDKIILFIDEIHMLMGATNESSLDFANMFKESLGRGSIKMIGATTNDEYERYILRDKAFVRRFQRVDVEEPTREQTIKILMGTLPKIEKNTGAKLKYSNYVQTEIMAFIVDITTEYKRVYGIGSRYPDICLTLLSQAFSQAVFDNRMEVTIADIRNAIANSKNIYPDVIRKELINFDNKFNQLIKNE